MKNKNILIIIIALILILIIFGIYYLIKKNQEKNTMTTTPTASLSPSSSNKAEGKLKISYSPPGSGAVISGLDSNFITYKENESLEFNLPAGKYWLTVYHQNYENYDKLVIIEEKKTQELTVNLIYLGSDIKEGGPPGKNDIPQDNPNNLIPKP